MEILVYPDKSLVTVAKEVQIDEHVLEVIREMIHIVYSVNALGLAATQVGEPIAVFVIDVKGKPLVAINPTLLLRDGIEEMDEACLSLPGISGTVPRHKTVTLLYTDIDGKHQKLEADGRLAQAIQHEMDHLHGELYWSKLSTLKRDMLKRRYGKVHKHEEPKDADK
jgi:peptide deformylase